MNNTMLIDGYRAVIQYDPEIDMFRGELTGLNGGADFYANTVESLREEGRLSLQVFLDACNNVDTTRSRATVKAAAPCHSEKR